MKRDKVIRIARRGNGLIVHKVNVENKRLVQLSEIADEEKPFYEWIEHIFQEYYNDSGSLHELLMDATIEDISKLITKAMNAEKDGTVPSLVDGVGRVYAHKKAVFFFFAWLIRDAPAQRLNPLIKRMRELDDSKITTMELQVDTLAELIFEYKQVVRSFEWDNFRDILINRLEGSRRSLKGHEKENIVRTALFKAIQTYYKINSDYGNFTEFELRNKQFSIGQDTIDVSAIFKNPDFGEELNLLIPVKSRETQGGGHANLFSRDIVTAIKRINEEMTGNKRFVVVIIAENWSENEISEISEIVDMIFHFDMNPNDFSIFEKEEQRALNRYIKEILN